MTAPDIPSFEHMLWPALQALISLGGSAALDELDSAVVAREGWTDAQQAILHREGPRTLVEYRLAWARTYLKGMGLVTNSARRVWTVTETGRTVAQQEVPHLYRTFGAENRRRTAALRAAKAAQARQPGLRPVQDQPGLSSRRAAVRRELQIDDLAPSASEDLPDDEPEGEDWRTVLLATLLRLHPSAFERLAQRLLREAGFVSATVTGRSGDGGIDGLGVYRLSLLSFPVFFQCKRYRGSVGAGEVRDFRGAMAGRGDKGLLITTGAFTAGARAEATRDGAPSVDLIDGDRLCDLLLEYRLGVTTTVRTVEDVSVDAKFFDSVAAG